MSFTDDFFSELDKKKKKKKTGSSSTRSTNASGGKSYSEKFMDALGDDISPLPSPTLASIHKYGEDDIAPAKGGNKDSIFKSGGFSDGVDGVGDFFVDLGQTVLGTAADVSWGVAKGAGRMVEGLVDLGAYGVAEVADKLGAGGFAEKAKKVARYNATDEWTKDVHGFVDQYSILGNKADAVSEGLGQVGAIILTGAAGAAAGLGAGGVAALTTGATGLSSMGTNMGDAFESGATDDEAFWYGLSTGAIEAGTELLFGGLGKGVKALGISRGIGGLDEIFAKKLSSKIAGSLANESVQKALGNTVEYAVKAGGEGVEEVLSGLGSAVMKKLTYADDKTLRELIEDENLLEQFVVGTVVSGIAQGGDFVKATKSGTDFVTGHTAADEKVIDKVVEEEVAKREATGEKLSAKDKNKIYDSVVDQMEKGQIDIDTIESVLGGDTYKAYKETVDSEDALKNELAELRKMKSGDMNDLQTSRMNELKGMNLDDTTKRDGLRKNLDDVLSPMLKDSKLSESYRERERRGQAFEADLSKYTGKQRAAVERAVKSGVLNNTYRSHELVDVLSKIEADKGIAFDYTNNAKLKESGFAVEGKTVNGFANKSKGAVTLNVQSAKAWQSVVGHEITHVLEGTDAYSELRNALYAYAESKGELEGRRASLTALYQNMDADIDAELTADLVGDYLFTDKAFINNLTGNRTLFQKIYDEIKYLWNVATGKEKNEIDKVKAEFDRVWKEYSNNNDEISEADDSGEADIDYSISVTDKATLDFLDKQKDSGDVTTVYRAMQAQPVDENGNVIKAAVLRVVSYSPLMVEAKTFGKNGKVDIYPAKLFSPMAGMVNGKWSNSIELNKWEQTTFDLANATTVTDKKTGKPKIDNDKKNASYGEIAYYYGLVKGGIDDDGKKLTDVPARYNPYIHTSLSALNDQFSSASKRPELVTVECIIPNSELTSGFRAEGAKDRVGAMNWHSGPTSSRLAQVGKARTVILTRYDMPVRVLPDSEVAKAVAEYIGDTENIAIQESTVTPSLSRELMNLGISVLNDEQWKQYSKDFPAKTFGSKKKVQYSISAETDAEYMSAVERGDTETAQRMVDEAAKKAGYDYHLYHGTDADFTKFDLRKFGGRNGKGEGYGIYLAANREISAPYGKNVINSYTKFNRLAEGRRITLTKAEVKRIIQKSCDIEAKRMVDDGEYDSFSEAVKDTWVSNYVYTYDYPNMSQVYTEVANVIFGGNDNDGDIINEIMSASGGHYNYDGALDFYDNVLTPTTGIDGFHYIWGNTDGSGVQNDIYLAFNSEQIKSADPITYDDNGNVIPLSQRFNEKNEDIRFSLSNSVEETKDLMALHNLQSSELIKTLELGGLPMPSIAVIKDTMSHEEYGDVSLILPKEAIDPQANKDNKVYGGDAWTPTYPRIEYKPNEKVAKRISDKYYELARVIGYDEIRPMYRYVNELEDALNRDGGEAPMLEKLYDDTGMMNLYLQDSGKGKIEPITKETVTKISDGVAEMNQYFIDALGEDFVASYKAPDGVNGIEYRSEFMKQHEEKIRDVYKRYFMEEHGFTAEETENVFENITKRDLTKIMRDAYMYTQNKGVTVRTETDHAATEDAIRKAAADGYKEWVDGLFKGIEEKSGIRNNQDYYTRSGNPRSWDALHWENTLENVIKVMKGQEDTGVGSFSPFNNLFGASHKRYGSIQDIKADSDRLGEIDQDEYDAMKDSFSERFAEIAASIKDPDERNQFIATDTAAEQIIEAVRTRKTKTGILNHLKSLNSSATMQTVDDVLSLVSDIANMPTGYFEAKPQRAVSLDEVGVFVIPRNADLKLKQELLNRGYSIAEYDPDVEGDRQKVVNQFEEYKFSLSNVGEEHVPVGNYSTPFKELALEGDIAPVSTNTPTAKANTQTAKANTPTVQNGDLFPDGYAPVTEEEADALSRARYETITDADAPPEMDAPYYESEESDPADPFENRDIKAVGSQKVKAYMYENPEVKPFFQKEADILLGELQHAVKGERIYAAGDFGGYGAESYYRFMGTKRHASPDIEYLLDECHYSYEQIEKGIKAILEDNGAENNAASKRIEFVLNDRLRDGYQDWGTGIEIPPDEGYLNLLREKEITEYNEEAFKRLAETADDSIIPPVVEDIAPITETATEAPFPDEVAPMTEEEANAIQDEKAKADAAVEGLPKSRKQLHSNIIKDVKATFSSGGFDLDDVLSKAKDLSTFSTVDNTPQRVMEKALGYKEGQVLADLTVNKVAQNETKGIKWLNSFTDRKNGLLAKISNQYSIKPGSKESAAAQMYAEGFYVNDNNDIVAYGDAELAKDFPDVSVQNRIKGLAGDPRIRQIYDETLEAINKSRARNAYPEIQRLENYFLHFRAMDDTFSKLGIPFNPNDIRAKDLPTDLNGVTADLKPGQPYFASSMHRKGKRTSFDLLGGLERYLTAAKNQIYHIDDIQTLRALRNYIADTYGQAKGLEVIDLLSEEEAQDRIEKVYDAHLSTFAKFLNEEANVLAGKTALIDRGLEGIIGRRGMTFLDTVNRQVGSNMVGFNISSSLTNFLPVAQTFAKTNKFDFLKAFTQTVSNKFGSAFGNSDSFTENSPVIIRRKGADRFYRTPFQKAGDAGYALMSAVDDISTELIARTKFNELTRKGMDEQTAHFETDKWVSRLMGDRSLGQQPQLYNSKMLGVLTKFQLEVRNQLDSQFYDTIQEAKVSNEHIENALARNAKTAAKVTATFVELAVVQHLFGKAFESVAGYNPAFDIISTLATMFGWDDDEEIEDTVLDNIEQGFLALLEDLPYTSTLTGGRIPIANALPVTELIKGVDSYGNEKSRWETLGEAAPYYILPGGYGQIKKTAAGLNMFSDDHPVTGSYTDSGKLRFPVEDTPLNRVQAAIFGQYASKNAREYFDNGYAPLSEKQTQEFIDVDMPIKEYREYREGLKKQETLEDKFDYISGLDLPVAKKNILINNVVDRKEAVDLEGYEDFGSLEEFDFATKNPEKYAFAKSVGGYSAYKTYSKDLGDFHADKDENGKKIKDSRKEKVLNYINNLDADFYTKVILYKSEYPGDDTYNRDIVNYINEREDLSYEDRVAILTELGFRVTADGQIYAD